MSKNNFDKKRFAKGVNIFREGTPGRCAFLIQSGSVEVYKEVDGGEVVLCQLDVGEIFGETALIFYEPRSASVRAITDCTLVVIDRSLFTLKLKKSDPTVRAIIKMLSRRVLAANDALVEEQRDLGALVNAARVLFENVFEDLPAIKKKLFDDGVRPKFEEFIAAIESLETRFEAEADADDYDDDQIDAGAVDIDAMDTGSD